MNVNDGIPDSVKTKLPPPKFRRNNGYFHAYLSWYRRASRMALSEYAAEIATWKRRGNTPRLREVQTKLQQDFEIQKHLYAERIAWLEKQAGLA